MNERKSTKTRFEKEAKGNSEMAYLISWEDSCLKSTSSTLMYDWNMKEETEECDNLEI